MMWTDKELKFLSEALDKACRYTHHRYIKKVPVENKHPLMGINLHKFPTDKREIYINVGPFHPDVRPDTDFVAGAIRLINEFLVKKYNSTTLCCLKSFKMMDLNKGKNANTTLDCLRIVCTLVEDY